MRSVMFLASLMIALSSAFTVPMPAARAAALPARSPLIMSESKPAPKSEPERSFPNANAAFRDSPSEDPTVTCFLAPDWMGSNQWVCSNTNFHDSSSSKRKTYQDDSY